MIAYTERYLSGEGQEVQERHFKGMTVTISGRYNA